MSLARIAHHRRHRRKSLQVLRHRHQATRIIVKNNHRARARIDLHAGNAGDHRHIVGNQFGTCRRHRAGRDPPLTDRGIDPERLILEEQSANTRQNLQNSLALLPDDYHKTVAIVTNDFHMGRVRLLLNAAGPGRVVQVPAKLPWWWLSANYYLRESFAVVNDQVVRPLLA